MSVHTSFIYLRPIGFPSLGEHIVSCFGQWNRIQNSHGISSHWVLEGFCCAVSGLPRLNAHTYYIFWGWKLNCATSFNFRDSFSVPPRGRDVDVTRGPQLTINTLPLKVRIYQWKKFTNIANSIVTQSTSGVRKVLSSGTQRNAGSEFSPTPCLLGVEIGLVPHPHPPQEGWRAGCLPVSSYPSPSLCGVSHCQAGSGTGTWV